MQHEQDPLTRLQEEDDKAGDGDDTEACREDNATRGGGR